MVSLSDSFNPIGFSLGEFMVQFTVDEESGQVLEPKSVTIPEELVDLVDSLVTLFVDGENILLLEIEVLSDLAGPPVDEVFHVVLRPLLKSTLRIEAEEHILIEHVCAIDFVIEFAHVSQVEVALVDLVDVLMHVEREGRHFEKDRILVILEEVQDSDSAAIFGRDFCETSFAAGAHIVEYDLHFNIAAALSPTKVLVVNLLDIYVHFILKIIHYA